MWTAVFVYKVPLGSSYNWCPGQDLINREQELRREKNFFFSPTLYQNRQELLPRGNEIGR